MNLLELFPQHCMEILFFYLLLLLLAFLFFFNNLKSAPVILLKGIASLAIFLCFRLNLLIFRI
jgi:hypothetical protein